MPPRTHPAPPPATPLPAVPPGQLPLVLTPVQLAEVMGVPLKTVYRWNVQGAGPTPGRFGKHVRYRREDVTAWLAERAGGQQSA